MTRKTSSLPEVRPATQVKRSGPARIPAELPDHLLPFAAAGGASIVEVALAKATPEQVRRAQEVTGPFSYATVVGLWHKTQNPVWLWVSIHLSPKLDGIDPEVAKYLRGVAKQIFNEVVKQACLLEKVRIELGKEFEEGMVRQKPSRSASPDVASILGLARPGRNLFQAAAGDLRDLSITAAVEVFAREQRQSRDEAYAVMARVTGRISTEAGPATDSIRKIAARGKWLISGRTPKRRGQQP